MKNDRYVVPEDEDYEPDSNNAVLKNLLGIKDPDTIEQLEAKELVRLGLELIELYDENHRFRAEDICNIHELWLAELYPFAGKYRTVMMSKDGFPFANPERIPKLMTDLETKYLKEHTPCSSFSDHNLAFALGLIHVELIVIHPFREGNGRVARILANLMALQAGKDILDYARIDKTTNPEGFNNYITAIHEGFCGNYENITNIFFELLTIAV